MDTGYSFLNCGTCLGDIVPDGSLLDVDASRDIEIGDIVAVAIKADGAFSGLGLRLSVDGFLGLTKIFLGTQQALDGETIYLFGQLNPPVIAPVPESALQAMHLVTGVAAGFSDSGAVSEADRAAIDLLGPFFRASPALAPIGQQWRPPEANQ